MQTRTPKTVWVVSALSLCLGLSLGHIQQLNHRLAALEKEKNVKLIVTCNRPGIHPLAMDREIEFLETEIRQKMERLRARVLEEVTRGPVLREE